MRLPKLLINSIWCNQRLVLIDKESLSIGRTPDNDIIFTHQCVSRSHAYIERVGDNVFLIDKKSKHGTYVNKVKISKHTLKDKDVIHLGLVRETEMVYQAELEADTHPGMHVFKTSSKIDRSDFEPRELQLLLEISKAINSTLILDDVLDLVMDAVIQLTHAQHGFLMLKNSKNELEVKVARNMRKESIIEGELQISKSIVNKVAETGEPLISGNILEDERFKSQQSVVDLNLKTVMCVPLKIISPEGSRVIGLIYVHDKSITPRFLTKILDLLDYMALHAAIAIENAKSVEETRIRERMNKELEIAYQIQTSLLPQTFPDIEGLDIFARSIPAAQVGGDLYFFLQLDESRMAVAIGDVIGKSIPAALYMSATYSILETLLAIRQDFTPKELVTTMNTLLCQKTKGSNFVTFLYGILDLKKMEFIFSNAGHNYPVLLRDGVCTEYQCSGPALGMFDEDQFDTLTIDMQKGDSLILYTDGIIEAIDTKRIMFSYQRLAETIINQGSGSSKILGSAILDSVKDYAVGTDQFDDMTVVCLRLNTDKSGIPQE